MLVYIVGHPQWCQLVLGPSRISTLECVSMVVLVSGWIPFAADFIDPSFPGHTSTSAGSTMSSEASAVPTSIRRTRAKRIKTDEDVWDWSDKKIIGEHKPVHVVYFWLNACDIEESRKTWKSAVYGHYNISLECCNTTHTLTFQFTCRFDPTEHASLTHARAATSQGTSNLERGRHKCDKAHGVDPSTSGNNIQLQPPPQYSYAKYRAFIAAHCASSRRPFNSVADPHYIQEVEMLRPGTKLPSPATVSRDVNRMYEVGVDVVQKYFSVCFSHYSLMFSCLLVG